MLASFTGPFGTDTATLVCERTFKRNGTKRGVIWCHGRNQFPWGLLGPLDPLMAALAEAGFPVIIPILGANTNWGNNTDTQMTNALAQLVSVGAKSEPPLIVCYSMGGLAAFNWIAHGNAAAAVVGEAPLVNFTDFYSNNLGGFQSEIQTTYGGAGNVTSALPTHDPNLQTGSVTGTPAKLYYGDTGSGSDGTIPVADVTGFATSVGAAAQSIGNVTHANVPASIPVGDAFNFLTSHA